MYIDDIWNTLIFSGKLDGEVESLPVGLIVDGNGRDPSISTLAVGIEIICEPTEEAISTWQTKTHALILAANQRRFADYEERVANRDATARLQLQSFSDAQKAVIIQAELKRTTLAVLTNQNFRTFNANRIDALGFPYPDAAAATTLAPYIRFFEQAVEWQYLAVRLLPLLLGFAEFLGQQTPQRGKEPALRRIPQFGGRAVVLPIRPGYEKAVDRFLNTGTIPTTDELLDVGGPLWVCWSPSCATSRSRATSKRPLAIPGNSASLRTWSAPGATACCRSGR